MKLGDKVIDALPIPTKGHDRYPSDKVTGLNAQITSTGERGFVMRATLHGRDWFYTIGHRPSWTTKAAEYRAMALRRLIDQGLDPKKMEAQERHDTITISEFWRRVYEPLRVPALSASWQRNVRSMMHNDILPKLGRLPVKEIDQADVTAVHREVSRRAATRANRVKTVLSGMFAYAEKAHILPGGERILALRPRGSNPARGVTLNREDRRQRFLTPQEIARLAAVLDARKDIQRERSSVALVKLLLLTGCRFAEGARAEWSQFDLEQGTWCKPAGFTKQRREHVTPLSAPALALLQQLREQGAAGQYLFPGPNGRPLSRIHHFWASTTRQAGLDGVRLHDLRHSFASVLAAGGASLLLIGELLGHSRPTTTARYAHLLDDVRREAVERAGAVITGQPGAEIVPLRQQR